MKNLQSIGLGRWPAAQKHAVLRPFAWAHQVGRNAKLLALKIGKGEGVRTDVAEARRRRKLNKQIGLYD